MRDLSEKTEENGLRAEGERLTSAYERFFDTQILPLFSTLSGRRIFGRPLGQSEPRYPVLESSLQASGAVSLLPFAGGSLSGWRLLGLIKQRFC